MKIRKFRSIDRFCILILGLYLYLMRKGLFALAVDEKGLLTANHPLELALWAVALVGAVLVFALVRKRQGSDRYEDNFAPSVPGGVSHFLLAGAVGLLLLTEAGTGDGMALARTVLGWLSVPALIWAGLCRQRGKRPHFLTHGILCLFLLLQLILQYRIWSGDPQMQDYIFELFALVGLVLFSYQCAAFEADMGKGKEQMAIGLLTVLACGGALAGTQMGGLFLAGGLWALTNLCVLSPKQEVPHEAA